MGDYNTVNADLACPSCGVTVHAEVQFKYARVNQLHYALGDALSWSGEVNPSPHGKVILDGEAERCASCGYDGDWQVYVVVVRGALVSAATGDGSIDFGEDTFVHEPLHYRVGDADEMTRAFVEAGIAKAVLAQHSFDLLETSFPVRFKRIRWDMVEQHRLVEVLPEPRSIAPDELRAVLEKFVPLVRTWVRESGTGDHERVTWIGDSTDTGLDMPVEVGISALPELMAMAQHTYILCPARQWCLNYVTEGTLYFGIRGGVRFGSPRA